MLVVNLRTGSLSESEAACGDWIVVDPSKATITQLRDMRVSIYDRRTAIGKELSSHRSKRNIKDGLSALSRNGNPKEIDLSLAVMCALLANGEFLPMSQAEIADVCGCTRQAISLIEKRALKKLRGNATAIHLLKEAIK